ncbi:UNVERIFIED_CONTAM: hypothetical protein GTU68_053911, partial [Idotea baltica]|nr:hypothetical protein [Idotea baltica]
LHTIVDNIPHDENIIVCAAKQLQNNTGCILGADIWLEKNLPIGGGLGGGSSNAATTLKALNILWALNWSDQQLADLGLTLGADVPVFVLGNAAFAEGIGEKLTPINLTEPWFLVTKPSVSINTKQIFLDPELTRNTPAIKVPNLLAGALYKNDCQKVVERRYPEVQQALSLMSQFTACQLTGTGSCIFGCFQNHKDADKIREKLSTKLPFCFVAKGRNVSLLHRTIKNYKSK